MCDNTLTIHVFPDFMSGETDLKVNFCVRVRLGVGFNLARGFLLIFVHIFIL